MQYLIVLLSFLLTMVGVCAPVHAAPTVLKRPRVVEFHADRDFTTAERWQIAQAANLWKLQTGDLVEFRIRYDVDFSSTSNIKAHRADNLLVRWEDNYRVVRALDDMAGGRVLGFVDQIGGIHNPAGKPVHMFIVADRHDTQKRFRQTALHEFGHVLGLYHSHSITAVMYPSSQDRKAVCLSRADLHIFCDVNNCDGATVYPCN